MKKLCCFLAALLLSSGLLEAQNRQNDLSGRWTVTLDIDGSPLYRDLSLLQQALTQGFRYLAREPMRSYQNKGLHTWIAHWIYADTSPSGIFATPLYCGILALIMQLPFSLRKDSCNQQSHWPETVRQGPSSD